PMEWSQQTIKHQIGADQQFGFHEFVPGGSNQPLERLGEVCSTQASSSGSAPVLRPPLETHEAEHTVDANLLQFHHQNPCASVSFGPTNVPYQPSPSGPLVASGGDTVNCPTTSVPAISLSCIDQNTARTQLTEGTSSKEFEDISKPTPSGLCLLPAQIKEQCATADRSPTDQKSEDVMDDEAKSSVLEGSAGEDFDPLTVDTMVKTSETGEPLVEQISEHGQNIKIDPLDTFWIQCDCCEKWFHGNCVGVEEYEDVLIDKFHCAPCAQTNGPTI
ncbi:hypothetical protein OSTOST_17800, partial [Ostertagia ostertagi]